MIRPEEMTEEEYLKAMEKAGRERGARPLSPFGILGVSDPEARKFWQEIHDIVQEAVEAGYTPAEKGWTIEDGLRAYYRMVLDRHQKGK